MTQQIERFVGEKAWLEAAEKIENPYWDYLVQNVPSDDKLSFRRKGLYAPEPYGFDWENEDIKRAERKTRVDLVAEYSWAIPSPASLAFVADRLERYLGSRRVVEMGAGAGYWAWMLSQLGVDVLAFDSAPPDVAENWYHSERERYVRTYTQEDVEEHNRRWGPLRESAEYLVEATKDSANPWPASAMPRTPQVGDPWEGERVVPGYRRPVFHPVRQASTEALTGLGDRALLLCWPPYEGELAVNSLLAYEGDVLVYVGAGEGGCCADDAFFALLDAQWREVDALSIGHTQWSGIHDEIRIYVRKEK